MIRQALQLEVLAEALHRRISGRILLNSFSTSRTDLWFIFESLHLHFVFYKGEAYLLVEEFGRIPLTGRQPAFSPLHGSRLIHCRAGFLDRSYTMDFGGDVLLRFEHYGRNSRIILIREGHTESSFPPGKTEAGARTEQIEPVRVEEQLNELTPGNISEKWKFLSSGQVQKLIDLKLFQSEDRGLIWSEFLRNERSLKPKFHPETGELCWLPDPEQLVDVLVELNAWSRYHLKRERLADLKHQITSELDRTLKLLQDKLRSVQHSLRMKQSGLSYRQKADILMANMHLQPDNGYLECYDFYQDQMVKIPLQRGLSIQDNAAKMYKKARHEHLEVQELQKREAEVESRSELLRLLRIRAENSETREQLNDIAAEVIRRARQSGNESPGPRSYTYQGFQVRVGGNARQNEQLLREAGKDDLWLHIRDYSGAHVLVAPGSKVPEHVIEFAASLAAWHSKARKEKLAVVMYTPRKYVRKFRGATAGQVKVEREKSLIIQPDFWKSCLGSGIVD